MVSNKKLANALRALSLDMIELANSGHFGLPLGFADVIMVLFKDFLKFNPLDPTWAVRDRLILSAGHGSALLYAALFLSGYDYSIEDLKNFRRLGSKTPGHPEYAPHLGIETTTGPLGQGIANAVGIAISAKVTNTKINNFQHKIYAIVGDGCLMEGISYEATSLAGHLQLDNLIVIFDSNNISIDGPISLAFSENIKKRFESINWLVLEVNGHDYQDIHEKLLVANSADKPVIIIAKTTIGYGSLKHAGQASAHGYSFSSDEVQQIKYNLGCLYNAFEIPDVIVKEWRDFWQRCSNDYEKWQIENRGFIEFISDNKLYDNLFINLKKNVIDKPESTRKTAGTVLEALIDSGIRLIGGSADLTSSNYTKSSKQKVIKLGDFDGSYIHYGIREHAMATVMNGIAIHGVFRPYGGTFLVFSDYCRPAIRLAALMKLPVIYIMTHDSIGLGEDGPTHQPVEHLASLRAMPNLIVLRPADAIETIECFEIAIQKVDGPVLIALSRQNLPLLRSKNNECTTNNNNLSKMGGYVLKEANFSHQITIIATGSEVVLACEVATIIEQNGLGTRVISMPSLELFSQQSIEYKQNVIKNGIKNIIIEAASESNWNQALCHNQYIFCGLNSFGESGNIRDLYQKFGLEAKKIVQKIFKLI